MAASPRGPPGTPAVAATAPTCNHQCICHTTRLNATASVAHPSTARVADRARARLSHARPSSGCGGGIPTDSAKTVPG
eukprot:5268289-Pyramimonas_sp.AAC.1